MNSQEVKTFLDEERRAIVQEYLELGIVDVRPVQCNDISAGIVGGVEHEAVVSGCLEEL